MPDDPIVAVSKVLPKGVVQIPLEVREKLNLKPGTKMIVIATEDAVVLQKIESIFFKGHPRGVVNRLRSIFSKVPIRNIEE